MSAPKPPSLPGQALWPPTSRLSPWSLERSPNGAQNHRASCSLWRLGSRPPGLLLHPGDTLPPTPAMLLHQASSALPDLLPGAETPAPAARLRKVSSAQLGYTTAGNPPAPPHSHGALMGQVKGKSISGSAISVPPGGGGGLVQPPLPFSVSFPPLKPRPLSLSIVQGWGSFC